MTKHHIEVPSYALLNTRPPTVFSGVGDTSQTRLEIASLKLEQMSSNIDDDGCGRIKTLLTLSDVQLPDIPLKGARRTNAVA